ncbi:hypothetical protein AB5N19_05593 [Seiridium cardinale]
MGFRQRLKRFASVRDRSKGTNSDTNYDADALAPINGPFALLEEPDDSAAERRFSDPLGRSSDDLPSASERASSEPRKPTGKRKPSNASKLRQSSYQRRAQSEEPRPQDYLYFGESQKYPRLSPASSHQVQAKSSSGTVGATVPNHQTTGRDNSGFLNTGMNNQQMGYQNLTYGGSLQYDYSGVQAPGTGGS